MRPRTAIPIIIVFALVAGLFVYPALTQTAGFELPSWFSRPFKLGLDIQGGTHLVYNADVSDIAPGERDEAMEGLKDVIERRVNLFGVSEPVVTVNKAGENWRLIVELAGVTNVNEAINLIGQTPFLEFRVPASQENQTQEATVNEEGEVTVDAGQLQPQFTPTELTGRYLEEAQLDFNRQTSEPIILLQFNEEGAQMFAEITRQHIGEQVAIFLDGQQLSAPVVQQEITGGQAQITGQFGVQEARQLVSDLNAGALPVPIELVSQQTVGATLGQESLDKSLFAGIVGFALVALFMIAYYRMAGVVSVVALAIYTIAVLTIFKLLSVTLTLAGIVGFILSIGMAVDANILIFEMMKEELREGKAFRPAMQGGFSRAWTAIRDAYTSTIMTAVVLYWFGTSLVRGFALTLGLGLVFSLLSAVILTKTFLRGIAGTKLREIAALWKQ